MAAEPEHRLYRFDPADTSGVFLGLGLGQCVAVGSGLTASVLALSAGLALPLAALPAAGGAAVSFARLGGRPLWGWLALLWAWGSLRVGRGRRWVAPLALLPDDEGRPLALPPCLAGLSVLDLPWRGRQRLGAVRDDQAHTLTAVVRVAGPAFVVQPRAEQERLVAGWGDVLNGFATEGGPVSHLSWSDLAAPSGLEAHRAWLDSLEAGEVNAEARASYDELLATATATAAAHDVVVSVTVARSRLGRSAGDDPEAALARALASSLEALLRAAHSAGLEVAGPLGAAELQRVLRTRCDPALARPAVVGGRLVDRLGLVGRGDAGPMAVEASWAQVRIDAAVHRTYKVVAWPRLPVPPGWLEPFLAGPGVTRTMTVVFCPVSAYQSRRRIERDLVKLESDATTKQDKGRRVDARHRRATQALLDREAELVAGYAEVAYLGLVGVSAASEEALAEACEVTEQAAREVGMELRCLEARQDLAWASALPFGLAPRHLLAG